MKINAATATVVSSIELTTKATDFDIDPSADRLYVASLDSATTMAVDLTTFSVTAPPLATSVSKWVEADGKGQVLLSGVPGNGPYINIWNIANQSRNSTYIESGDIEVSVDGEKLYRLDSSNRIAAYSVVNPASTPFLSSASTSFIKTTEKLRLCGNGSLIAFNNWVFDADLKAVIKLPDAVKSLSPDGALAVGLEHVRFTSTGLEIGRLPVRGDVSSFSQDGKYLLFFDALECELRSLEVAPIRAPFESSPLPGEILDQTPAMLEWPEIADTSSYTVTVNGGPDGTRVIEGIPSNSLALDPPLAPGWTYYWSVSAHTGKGIVRVDPISFSIRFQRAFSADLGNLNGDLSSLISVALSDNRMIVKLGGVTDATRLFTFDPQAAESSFLQNLKSGPQDSIHSTTAFLMGQPVISALATGPFIRSGLILRYKQSGAFFEDYSRITVPDGSENQMFGSAFATDGDTLLAGNPSSDDSGQVIAFLASGDSTASTQVLTSDTPRTRDFFGAAIALDGNTALITAPGLVADAVAIPTVYMFERDPSDGQWKQYQAFALPGATATDYAGNVVAMSGDFAAIWNESRQHVVLLHRENSGQWAHFKTIGRAELAGSSGSVGGQLALDGNILLIGDRYANPSGATTGAVYVFRKEGAEWIQAPYIPGYFPSALALRSGWAAFYSKYNTLGDDPALLGFYHVDPDANHKPSITSAHPSAIVTARHTEISISADDPDGIDGLVIDALSLPEGLALVDHGNGSASLVGTPAGSPGSSTLLQLRVTDKRGGSSLQTSILRLLSAQDLPVVIKAPLDLTTSERREIKLYGEVSGEGPFRWQWQKDGENIPGAQDHEMIIPDALPTDAGSYRFIVSNAAGQVISNAANVMVLPARRAAGHWSTFGNSASRTGFHPAALGSHTFVPAWTKTLTQSIDRPVIAEGKAFLSSSSGKSVSAINLKTGQTLWTRSFKEKDSLDACTYHNGRIHVQQRDDDSGFDGRFWVLDAETGSTVWDVPSTNSFPVSFDAPAVTDDGVWILSVSSTGNGYLSGYTLDGDTLFRDAWVLRPRSRQTVSVSNRRIFLEGYGTFQEFSPETGAKLWSASTGHKEYNTPAISGNRALVRTELGLACFDLDNRSPLWVTDFVASSNSSTSNTPAIKDGIAYVFQRNELITCSLATGEILTRQTSADGLDFSSQQPLLLMDHMICATAGHTYVYSLENGDLVRTLTGGGKLAYAEGYLLVNDSNSTLVSWLCNTALIPTPSLPSHVDAGDAAEQTDITLANSFINEDPGDVLSWSIVSNSRPEIFKSIKIGKQSGDLAVIYNPWQSGSSDLVVSVADSSGNVTVTTITFTVPAHPAPQLDVSSSITLNRQTGLYEHSIKITNSGAREIAGFDLTITGLPEGVCVNNGSDCVGGTTTVNHRQALAAGATVTLVLEYYAPARGTVLDPQVSATLVTQPDLDTAAAAAGIAVDRCLRQNDGSLLIEFTSVPGELYEMQYSEDAVTWKTSPVRIRAAGNRVQWIDRGPPRTDNPPSQAPCRFYRVLRVTEPG